MGSFLKSFFATILAIVVLCFGGIFLIAILASAKKPNVPSGATLSLAIPASLPDYPSTTIPPFGDRPLTLHDLRQALRSAAVDKRIDRVVLHFGYTDPGWASMEELRAEVKAVRAAGKPVYAYMNWITFRTYFLASACDSIWAPPSAWILFNGVSRDLMFRKGLMDKLGIEPRVHRIEAYKTAGEIDVRTDMSPESKKNAQWLLDETIAEVRQAIQTDRKKDAAWTDTLLALVSPSSDEAAQMGLIDRVAYWSDLREQWAGLGTESDSKIVTGSEYSAVKPEMLGLRGPTKVAIVHAQGAIAGEKSGENPILGGATLGSESLAKDLRKVADDATVDAVVLRIDSPGGETFSSDLMRRMVERLEAKKPLVVSMGDVAGSGGYMIAYPCSMIVANASTRTGSIGSIFQLPYAKGLMDKIGLTWDGVAYGPHAKMTSLIHEWTPAEWELVKMRHWQRYNAWVSDIARVRGMTFAQVDSLGRGRVWSGRQAAALGLVDSVGTLDDAIRIAIRLSGAKPEDKWSESHYPRMKTFVEALQEGDFSALRMIVARSLLKDAMAPVRDAWTSLESYATSPELSIDEDAMNGATP
jgi:protease-4